MKKEKPRLEKTVGDQLFRFNTDKIAKLLKTKEKERIAKELLDQSLQGYKPSIAAMATGRALSKK